MGRCFPESKTCKPSRHWRWRLPGAAAATRCPLSLATTHAAPRVATRTRAAISLASHDRWLVGHGQVLLSKPAADGLYYYCHLPGMVGPDHGLEWGPPDSSGGGGGGGDVATADWDWKEESRPGYKWWWHTKREPKQRCTLAQLQMLRCHHTSVRKGGLVHGHILPHHTFSYHNVLNICLFHCNNCDLSYLFNCKLDVSWI